MKVTLVGKQIVSYTKKQTGELKEGLSIFYMAPKEGVSGQCTDSLWISKDNNALYSQMIGVSFESPVTADVRYEVLPGGRYPRLVDIEILKQ